MGLGRGLLKMLLVVFSALFLIAGVAIVAVAIWTIADKVFVSHIIGTDLFSVASYFLLVGGIIVIITSIIGLVAISQQKRLLMIIFFVLLLIIFLLLLIGAIMAVVFRGELEEKMVNAMRDTLTTKYGNQFSDQETTAAWDRVQTELRCCSVNREDWSLYQQSPFFKRQEYVQGAKRKYVPPSCCVFDERMRDYLNVKSCQQFGIGPPDNPTTGLTNTYLYYDGCYDAAKAFLLDQSGILVAIGFVFSLTMICGLVLTILFIRRITLDADEEKRHRYTEEDRARDAKENEKL